MTGKVTYSNAIYNCSLECALRRAKRFGACNETFGSISCSNCRHYIGRYVDTEPIQLELYQYQADIDAEAMKSHVHYAKLGFNLLWLMIIGFIIISTWTLTKPGNGILGNSWIGKLKARNNTVQQVTVAQPYKPVVKYASAHQNIEAALWKVSKDLTNKVDVTYNGKSNCEDAAILFYQYYPNKNEVWIYANDNPKTGMSHAFNLVLINGVYRAIEPQAYYLGWKAHNTYFMRDIWGSKYDASLNKDAWNDYGRFVK